MTKRFHPRWGNYVFDGDKDMLAFGVLWENQLIAKAYYHTVQAIEKYLKALVLSVSDPAGTIDPTTVKGIRTHKLVDLAAECGSDPFYSDPTTTIILDRLSRYDQATRYSLVNNPVLAGFSTADLPVIVALIKKIRMDLPLALDDYPLGVEVRGFLDVSQRDESWVHWSHSAVASLLRVIPDLRDFVR